MASRHSGIVPATLRRLWPRDWELEEDQAMLQGGSCTNSGDVTRLRLVHDNETGS